jgi:hypothetical protein
MRKILLGLLLFSLSIPSYNQVVKQSQLPEVIVNFVNYKYISQVGSEDPDSSMNVKLLEREVANYDIKNSDLYQLYQDEYDLYSVSFYIPDGRIVAAYDKNGKVLRTIEKFKNIKLPSTVLESVRGRYPGWILAKDVYRVYYHNEKGAFKEYKIILKKEDKRLKIKVNENGEIL